VIGPGVITAAIERLRSDARLSRAEKRAVMLLAGGSVHGPKKALVLPGKTKAERDAERDARWVAVKAAVAARSGGRCECRLSGERCSEAGVTFDHFWSGTGRRRALESVESVWQLCGVHDGARTVNSPTRRFWVEAFEEHVLANTLRSQLDLIAREKARLEGKRR
jgi:hypothetical protein